MTTLAARWERLHKIRFLRFGLVGAGGFVVNWVILFCSLHFIHLDKYSAWFTAFFVAVTFTWWGNRTLTFHDRAAMSGLGREWLTFLVANGLGAIANFLTYFVLVTYVRAPLGNPLVAIFAGTLIGMVLNFFLSSRVVFRR